MADDGIVIRISGNPDDFKKAAEDVKKLFGGISEGAKKESDVATAAWGSFIGNFASTAVTSAIGAVKDGIGAVFGQFKEGLSDALQADQALQKFNLALANTGKFSTKTSDEFASFAEKLEKTTGLASEATLKSGALIQSLGNLSTQGLQRATQAAADLSAAIGVDFETAANLLGKASQGNVEALKKYGIQVEDTGNKTKDFETALRTIEGRFGGSAVNSVNNFAGALNIAKNSFDDIFKTLGQSITNTPALKGLAQGVGQVFQDFQKLIEDNKQAIQDFVTQGVYIFIDGIGAAGKAVQFFFQVQSGFEAFSSFVTDSFIAVVQTFNEFGLGVAEAKLKIEQFFGANTAGTEGMIQDYKNRIQALQEVRDEEAADLNATLNANDAKIQAIEDFTRKAQETVRARVDAAVASGEEENNAYLEQRNVQAQIAQDADAARLEEIRAYQATVLAEAQGILDQQVISDAKAQSDKLINEQNYVEAKRQLKKVEEQIEKDSFFRIQDFDKLTQKEKVANLKSTLGTIASLQSSSSQELFAIGKAAAIANATIDGISAVQKALSSAPPPFNFALAALVGTATALNVSKIASSQPPQGFAFGGLVTGGTPGIDSVPIVAQQGEIVAPVKSFDEVVEGTARQRGFTQGDEQAGVIAAIGQLGERIGQGGGVTLQVGTFIGDDNGINLLTEKIRDAVQFRGAQLA